MIAFIGSPQLSALLAGIALGLAIGGLAVWVRERLTQGDRAKRVMAVGIARRDIRTYLEAADIGDLTRESLLRHVDALSRAALE